MKMLFAFCQKTGRRLSRFLNRLVGKLAHKGQLKFTVAVSIPLLAKLEVSYEATLERGVPPAARSPGALPLAGRLVVPGRSIGYRVLFLWRTRL